MNKKSKILSTTINKNTTTLMDDFNSSIDIDKRLIEEDIAVTSAHVKALTKLKIISKKEALTIQKGLISILNDHKKGKLKFSKKTEDIHMNVESFLYEKIGEVANKIHTGRSRNDQVATDTRLWTIKASKNLKDEIKKSIKSIGKISDDISKKVKEQYEENPYPRWSVSSLPQKALFIENVINNDLQGEFLMNKLNSKKIELVHCK